MAKSYWFIRDLAKKYEASVNELQTIIEEYETQWDDEVDLNEKPESTDLLVDNISIVAHCTTLHSLHYSELTPVT